MMCCRICSKWQHISCHDGADSFADRAERKWTVEEFICQLCRSRIALHLDINTQPQEDNPNDVAFQAFVPQPRNSVSLTTQIAYTPARIELSVPRSSSCEERNNPAVDGNRPRKEVSHILSSASPTVTSLPHSDAAHHGDPFTQHRPHDQSFFQVPHSYSHVQKQSYTQASTFSSPKYFSYPGLGSSSQSLKVSELGGVSLLISFWNARQRQYSRAYPQVIQTAWNVPHADRGHREDSGQ
jgi:hypothetical protein